MSWEEELDEKCVDWKMSFETEILPEFHPTAHQISSYQTGVALIFSFSESVKQKGAFPFAVAQGSRRLRLPEFGTLTW